MLPTLTEPPDLATEAALVRRRLARHLPHLAGARLQRLGHGLDNAAWLADGAWVLRFALRPLAAELLANETRWLPYLAPHLPLPVPVPCLQGAPDDDSPLPFAGYRLIAGSPADRVPWQPRTWTRTVAALARFLSALHETPVPTGELLPGDPLQRDDLSVRAPKVHAWLTELANLVAAGQGQGLDGQVHAVDFAGLRELIDDLAQTPPWAEAPRWTHGDLYARHVLLDDGALGGVIDWGDLHVGDPAVDLSIAWSLLPPQVHAAFRASYGEVDPATWRRARFRALHHGVALALLGRRAGDGALEQTGWQALALAGPTPDAQNA